jgi:predicted DNA-binding transcriptional regulator YafY
MTTSSPNYRDGLAMVRIVQLLEQSRRRAILLDDLAATLEVHRRTARRYVQALEESATTAEGEPLVRLEGRGVKATVVLAEQREPTSSRLYQYAAVFAATRCLTTGEGSPLGDSAEQLVTTLEKGFERRLMPLVHRVQESFVYVPFGPKDYRSSEDVLDTIVQASVHRRPLLLRYRTRTGWAYNCHFEPWTVVLYRDALFVHGLQRGTGPAGGVRLLAVDRVQEAEIEKGERFEVPEDYDPEVWFGGQLGLWQQGGEPELVRIAFSERAALTAKERVWPGQVGWTEQEDGHWVLELEIPVTPEVMTWVLTWGPEAEVLGPEGLREGVVGVLEGAAALYGAHLTTRPSRTNQSP